MYILAAGKARDYFGIAGEAERLCRHTTRFEE
jgi:hypothetical protein